MTDHEVIGVPPDLSEEAFVRVLREAGSPALPASHAVYAYCVKRKVSPAFMLALFQHESSFGKAGIATITHSWGNTRKPAHGGVTPVDVTVLGQARSGVFPVFRDWIDGGIATVARLVDYAPYAGKTSVRDIVPIWAPAFDMNDPDVYIRKVLGLIARWTKEEGAVALNIIEKLTPCNHDKGRGGAKIGAVVWHVAEGSEVGVSSWFHNPESNASTHYLVCKDGRTIRYVREEDTPWANGKVNNPRLSNPVVKRLIASGANLNRQTISIETERYSKDWLDANSPMGKALVALTRDVMLRHGLPLEDDYILGHNEIDAVDRPNCPGNLDWDNLLAAVKSGAPSGPVRPAGYLEQGQKDSFNWNGAGVITYRKVHYYQPATKTSYVREWSADKGFTPWVALPK